MKNPLYGRALVPWLRSAPVCAVSVRRKMQRLRTPGIRAFASLRCTSLTSVKGARTIEMTAAVAQTTNIAMTAPVAQSGTAGGSVSSAPQSTLGIRPGRSLENRHGVHSGGGSGFLPSPMSSARPTSCSRRFCAHSARYPSAQREPPSYPNSCIHN